MPIFRPLSYGDLAACLSQYPPDSTVLMDHLGDEDWSRDFDAAPRTVGQVLDHCRAMPGDACPVIPTPWGRGTVVGMLFSVESPVFILAPR